MFQLSSDVSLLGEREAYGRWIMSQLGRILSDSWDDFVEELNGVVLRHKHVRATSQALPPLASTPNPATPAVMHPPGVAVPAAHMLGPSILLLRCLGPSNTGNSHDTSRCQP